MKWELSRGKATFHPEHLVPGTRYTAKLIAEIQVAAITLSPLKSKKMLGKIFVGSFESYTLSR
jgi:hypothetical protein